MFKRIFIVALFVLGNLLGSGFFIIPRILAALGSNSIYSWLICMSIALIYSLILGRLFELFPKSNIVTDFFNFNIYIKKIITVLYILCCVIGNIGVVLMIFNETLQITSAFAIGLFILSITLLNDKLKYEMIEKIEVLFSFGKFFILLFTPIALYLFDPSIFNIPAFQGDFMQIATISISSFWCFLGIETALAFGNGKEAKYGLLLGIIMCALLYIALSLFVLGSIPLNVLANSKMPFLTLLKYYNLECMHPYMMFLILFTLIGSLYSWIATVAKTIMFYAEADLLPSIFKAKTNSGFSKWGLYLSSSAMFIAILFMQYINLDNQFNFIADLTVKFSLILYCSCALILFKYNFFDKILSILGVVCTIVCFVF